MTASQFPPLQGKPSDKRCSNCSTGMTQYTLPGHYGAKVDIDVCMDCNAIWFDQLESSLLSPDGTVALFQLINERGGTATSAAGKFGEGLRCVTCGEGMRLVNDRVRNTRFAYQACAKGHGRLTTFYNFLSEKQFVRELTRAERAKLAATVQQVRCSGCGAPVNIGKTDACEYCRAPVSVFDREAAKKAIDHYLLERQKQPAYQQREATRSGGHGGYSGTYDVADLGTDILYALSRAAARGVSGAGRVVPVAGGVSAANAGSTLEPFPDAASVATNVPDATTALFGAGDVSASASSAVGAFSDALPSATDALFGTAANATSDAVGTLGGEIANVMSDTVSSAAGDVASSVMDGVGEVAASAGEGIVDLVTDGIGSLLGSLFD